MLIVAAVKKNVKILLKAFIAPAIFLVLYIVFITIANTQQSKFDNLPAVSVKENQITVLNKGNGQLSSSSKYILLNNGIIEEIDRPIYYAPSNEFKFGYTFEAQAEGKEVIVVAYHKTGYLSDADIYVIEADENANIRLENTEHISVTTKDEFTSFLVGTYSFEEGQVEKLY